MTAAGLPSLRGRRSLREEITELLRAAVMAGELEPGVTYSAPSLAEQFGVSATPVREAMLDLEKEGLVEIVRNKGFRVTSPSPEELDDVTELRALVEVPTIRALAERGVSAADLARLRPLTAEIEEAASRRDFVAHVALDLEFHLGLLELAGNPRIVELVRSLRMHSRLYGLRDESAPGRAVRLVARARGAARPDRGPRRARRGGRDALAHRPCPRALGGAAGLARDSRTRVGAVRSGS